MPNPDRPNILLITSDQQHWNTMGVTNPAVKTPALDRLCAEGTRFERAYCNNPTCTPSRASILTGLYPAWHHAYSLGTKLPEDVPTVNDALHGAGYDCSLIGKAHFQPLRDLPPCRSIESMDKFRDLEFWRRFHGPWYGFDHVELSRMHADEAWVGQHYALWMEEKGLADWADYFKPLPGDPPTPHTQRMSNDDGRYFVSKQRSWELPEAFHHNVWITDRTLERVERCLEDGRPFFSWASYFDPHPPYCVPEPWASMYDPEAMEIPTPRREHFDDMPPHFNMTQRECPDFSIYDEEGGHHLHGCHDHRYPEEELKKDIACYYGMMSFMDQQIGRLVAGLDKLGVAENTLIVFTTDHGHFFGQHNLIAKGPFHYEDMIRIPWVVRMPGTVPGGRVSAAFQEQVDIAPTALSFAGIDIPGEMQGVDQRAVWSGESESARDHAICENRHNPTTMHLRTYVDDRYKLTIYREGDFGEFFDLREDPQELVNRWGDPDYAAAKSATMERFLRAELQREPTRYPRVYGA